MLRHGPASALFVAALLCATCPARAESPGQDVPVPGYWDGGKWLGYVPAHLKYAERDAAPPASALVDQDEWTCGAADAPAADTSDPEIYCRTPWTWGRAEYLLWWTEGMKVPPLVTTSPDGTLQDQAGVLGEPGTGVLFGDAGFNSDAGSGGRFTLGLWLDPCESRGVEATYMTLGEETETFEASNHDLTILARPFFDIGAGQQDARLIAFLGLVEGSVSLTATTEFQGGEVLFRRAAQRGCYSKIDFLWGYRWAQLEDRLLIEESTLSLSGAASGTTIDLFDRFDTRNSFHGAEFGVSIQRPVAPCWSLELLAKIALGNAHSVAALSGRTTTTTAAGGVAVTQGGLLTQPTNIGRYERDSFATVSEAGVTLRRRFHCGLEATFGYTFMYLSDVARAGDQIDFDVNVSQLPPGPLVGAPRPAFAFQTTGFWAQGLNFGLHYRF